MIKKKLMGKCMVFFFLHLWAAAALGQGFTSENLLTLSALSKSRATNYLKKSGFTVSGSEQLNDTIIINYTMYRPVDSVGRAISRVEIGKSSSIFYSTSSKRELLELIRSLQQAGFVCRVPLDSLGKKPLLFQHHEYQVIATIDTAVENTKKYGLQVRSVSFPAPKDIYFADDLLVFSSHEFLEYYFGKENVKSDTYYFSDSKIARCSVLFLNSRRQVVFIWQDELNKCTIDRMLFGGQQQLKSSLASDQVIAENSWVFKSGIRPGMSLLELRKLHGNNFSFHGGNAALAGLVIADSTGRLNFAKESVFLSCINCNDNNFFSAPLINADDALSQELVLFILSVALSPGS